MHSNERNALEVVREIGQGAVALKLDLSRKSGFAAFAQAVTTKFETVWQRKTFDYLVNNGGVGGGMMFDDITDDYFNRILNTNFVGPFFLTRRLLPFMENGGAIVNTSSSASRSSSPGYSAYGASKAALTSWTRSTRGHRNRHRRITVRRLRLGHRAGHRGVGAFML